MNTDTLRDIMLYLPYKDVLAMCSAYQLSNQACNNDFWKMKIQIDYDIKVKTSNYKEEYIKLHDINKLVNEFIYVLDALLDKTKSFTVITLKPDNFFDDDAYEIYFKMTKSNNTYIIEITHLYSDNDKEEMIDIATLKHLLIDLLYHHPNIKITEGTLEYPIMYQDLVTWSTQNYKQRKTYLLQLWHDAKNNSL